MGSGVNANQEGIYENLINEDNEDLIFVKNILLRIKNDGPTFQVFVFEEQRKLMDIIKNASSIKPRYYDAQLALE